jgi:hypothetical protein
MNGTKVRFQAANSFECSPGCLPVPLHSAKVRFQVANSFE